MSPVAALRAGIREALATLTPAEWAEFQEMTALGMGIPEVRARMMDELTRTINTVADALARRLGRSPEDLAVRVYAGAVFGALMAVMGPETYSEGRIDAAVFDRADAGPRDAGSRPPAVRAQPAGNVEGSNTVSVRMSDRARRVLRLEHRQ